MPDAALSDYSLTGRDTATAIANGLAEATWYTSPVPKATMRELLVRRAGPAIHDTLIWFSLIAVSGGLGVWLWPSWFALILFFVYGTLYASTADSRWHESSHGTAFKTGWMNDALYEIASFMVMRESTPWRWSHTRHHSDTIIVGRDPEIAMPRPPSLSTMFQAIFCIPQGRAYFKVHVSARALPQLAQAACGDEGRCTGAVSRNYRHLPRDHPDRPASAQRPDPLRPTRAAAHRQPHQPADRGRRDHHQRPS